MRRVQLKYYTYIPITMKEAGIFLSLQPHYNVYDGDDDDDKQNYEV